MLTPLSPIVTSKCISILSPCKTPMMDRDLPSIENAIPELGILDGNVGYIVVNGMLPGRAARDAIAAALAFLHDADALISDAGGFWKSDSVGQLANSSVL